jgi:tetratricopeptide (TPR) repeat protein
MPERRRSRHLATIAAVAIIAAALPAVSFGHAGIEELERETTAEVQRRPDDPQAHLERARALQLGRQWNEALSEVDAAATRGADADDVGATRASILLDAGRAEPALAEIDRVLTRRPDAAALVFERGRALLALGRVAEAADELGRAIRAMPAPRPEQVIARRDALLFLGRREDALAALDEGMSRIGRVVSLELPAIDIEVELGRYDAALRRLDEVQARGPANPAWLVRRGEILERAGRTADARRAYARALEIIEQRPGGRRVKAWDELRQRIETQLASTSDRGGSK